MAKRTAEFIFVGNAADLIKAAKQSEEAIDRTAKRTKHASDEMDKFGKQTSVSARLTSKGYNSIRLGATGAFAAVGGLGFALKDSVKAASDVNESLSKNKQLFGDYAKGIEKLSDKSAMSFGVSKRALLEYTGVFGNLTRAQGFSEKSSAQMSVRLTKLAADLASFNNTSIDEALTSLRSGMVGETEPLRKFGIQLSAVAVQAEAARMGLVKVDKSSADYKVSLANLQKAEVARAVAVAKYGKDSLQALDASAKLSKAQERLVKTTSGAGAELTAQQKTLATNSLIFRQSTKAQGDAERTSKQFAGQVKILGASFDDLKVNLGTQVLPLLTRGANALTKFTKGMKDGTGAGGKFADTMSTVWKDAKPVIGALGSIAKFLASQPRLIEAVVVAWGAYKLASLASILASKVALGKLWSIGVTKQAAEGGAKTGAAFGAAANASAAVAMRSGKWTAIGAAIGARIATGIATIFAGKAIWDQITGGGLAGFGQKIGHDLGAALGTNQSVPKIKGTAGAISGFSGAFSKKYPAGADVTAAAVAAAQKYGASPIIAKALIEAGIVESGLRNLTYGDRDSVGFLQQRPSQGWKGLMNPEKAAAEFIAKAKRAYRPGMSAGQLAQAVQRSAFPGRYDQVGGRAEAILAGAGITGGFGDEGGGANPYTATALADVAATQREKAAAAREKRLQKEHDARVKRHEREERAASRAFNAISRRYSPDREIRLANLRGTAVERGDEAFGRLQARQDLSTEDVTTIGGRDKRKSEIAALAKAKELQLKREKQELAHYKNAARKLQQIIKAGTKQLSKTRGPARAKIRDRLQSVKDRLADINGSILALNGTIEDTQVELEQLGADSAQVDAEFAAAQPTVEDIVDTELGKIDMKVRAGDLTPEEGIQTKINLLTQAVGGQFGGMNDDQLLKYRAELGDSQRDLADALKDNTDKLDANTSALKESTDAQIAALTYARRVAETTADTLAQGMADLVSGRIAGHGVAPLALVPTGPRARY